MEKLEQYAERNVDESPDFGDLVQIANDPHSVWAIQKRDAIAAYLGIEPWEWEEQLYGR